MTTEYSVRYTFPDGAKNVTQPVRKGLSATIEYIRKAKDLSGFFYGEPMHKTFYYARVSTREQNLDRQLESFRALDADEREIITDKESGKSLDCPGYQALKTAMLRTGVKRTLFYQTIHL